MSPRHASSRKPRTLTAGPDAPGAPPAHLDPQRGLVGTITGRRTAWAVALIAFLLAGAVLGLVGDAERDPSVTDNLPAGAPSTRATALQEALPADDASVAIVLWTADGGSLTRPDLRALRGVVADLPGGRAARLVPAPDGTAAIAVVGVQASSATETADAVATLRADAGRDLPDGVTSQVTGPAAIQADLAAVFDGANVRLLLATAGVVALLLVVTYRSPVLWLVPLITVGVADRLAAVLATQTLSAFSVAWDESTTGILSVLVFGAGTDYALLLISRYRDELKGVESRHLAMARALRRTAEAVLASSSTVVLGLLTLLLSVIPATRGLGLACAVGVVVAAVFVLTVLPAFLVLFGRWIFWPQRPRLGETALVDATSVWRRVGNRVAGAPLAFVGATVVVLALLSAGLLRLEVGLDQADQFLAEPEAIAASTRLAESFPAGAADPTQVLTRADGAQVLAAVQGSPGVASAEISAEGAGITQIDAVLDADPGTPAAKQVLTTLRSDLESFGDTYVGGNEAEALDSGDAAQRDRLVILPLILVLVLGALLVLLRSVVAPIILVLTVLATYLAALGASWWIFTGVFGFEALDVGVPLLAFLFLVALGVDYNIFLVARAREEAAEHGTRQGMLRGLSATGGVITSAGILLAAVFAVLGVLPLVVLAQLGTVICIGVLLDTLVVRTLLVPAIALALGDRFWWPRRVGPVEADLAGARAPDESPAQA